MAQISGVDSTKVHFKFLSNSRFVTIVGYYCDVCLWQDLTEGMCDYWYRKGSGEYL